MLIVFEIMGSLQQLNRIDLPSTFQNVPWQKSRIFNFKRFTRLPPPLVFIPYQKYYWNLIANCSPRVSKEKVAFIFKTDPPLDSQNFGEDEGGERTFSKLHPFFRLRVPSRKTESSLRRKRKWVTHNINGGYSIPVLCDRRAFEHLPLPHLPPPIPFAKHKGWRYIIYPIFT